MRSGFGWNCSTSPRPPQSDGSATPGGDRTRFAPQVTPRSPRSPPTRTHTCLVGKRAAEAASALVPRAAHTLTVHTRPEVGSGQVGSQDVPAGQEGGHVGLEPLSVRLGAAPFSL
jgi:hypothetical protein